MKTIVFTVAALLVAGCLAGGGLPHPSAPSVEEAALRWPGVTLADLERGRDLYAERCSPCHMTPSPAQYSPARWPQLIDEMAARAQLSPAQRDEVLHYVVATSEPPSTTTLRSSR